ncbi:MAG: PD40 domain-containing protein [Anaerolineae bacterium]|nr:PD40 domain-containing protein [Anaerolineae bacterium]
MSYATAPVKRFPINRFDVIVISFLLIMALVTALILWRGDQVGLQVVTVSPASAATDVSTRSQIKVTFDQDISASETNQLPLTVSPPVSGTVHWDGTSLSFAPALPLASNTLYTVTLTGDVVSQRGRPLNEAISWQFQTGQPRLLYVAKDAIGNDQIFVIDPDGGDAVQLTQETYGVFDFALSPDASTIAYSALREDGGSDLWAISPEGQTRYPLLTCPEAVCNGVAWQPNSDRLIYERRNMLVPGAAPGPPRLWWLNLSNSETVAVFDDNQILGYGATWASDGRWLSYIAPSSQGVQVFNVDDGRNFVVPSRLGGLAVWDPAGESLLVADLQPSDEGFAVHLLKASPETGELVDLSGEKQLVEDTSPTWSPDGAWIALTRKAAGASMGKQVWLMRSDGSEAHSLTNDTEIHHGLPAWSPDGRYLAFQRFPLREIDAKPSIWLFDLETEDLHQLAADSNRPTWIP